MQAAHLIEPGRVEVRTVEEPIPGPGEVVVRVERALTCGTDLKAFRRGHPFIPMPGPFGHQYSGTIASAGVDVPKSLRDPIPIWGVHSAPCGECLLCQKQRWNLCLRLGEEMAIGAFTQFLRIPARVVKHSLLPRPPLVVAERAAFLEPVSCVVHALELIDWRGVDRILVLGLGAMGLLFTRLIPRYTNASIVAAGRNDRRLELARRDQVDRVIDIDVTPIAESEGHIDGYDCVIECTGKDAGWRTACDAVRPGGQVLFFGGLPKGTTFAIDTYRLHYEETCMRGCFHFSPLDVSRAAEHLTDPALVIDDLLSGRVPLDGLEKALLDMESGRGIKYAIDPWQQ